MRLAALSIVLVFAVDAAATERWRWVCSVEEVTRLVPGEPATQQQAETRYSIEWVGQGYKLVDGDGGVVLACTFTAFKRVVCRGWADALLFDWQGLSFTRIRTAAHFDAAAPAEGGTIEAGHCLFEDLDVD
ncbi:MAG: hypothetical protein KIS96_10980 [Bauldia sp.]|nr:hypothetical protein [Bauldia sp.]